MDYAELFPALDARVGLLLSPRRAAHSRGVATLAAELCSRHGLEPERGRIGGLGHDLCKEMPRKEQRALAMDYPGMNPGSALMATQVLHGPAAAVLIARDYGFRDDELLEAIALHTVGRPGMGLLATIIYCADKLEPGRGHVDEVFRDSCLAMPPGLMLRVVVADVVAWLESKGKAIAPETLLLYNSLTSPVRPT